MLGHTSVSKTYPSLFLDTHQPNTARVVHGLYFDKHKDVNWKVSLHQDLTIAVRRQVDIQDYGPWSIKEGIPHVQPPVSILKSMLALRLHLDDTNEENGALRKPACGGYLSRFGIFPCAATGSAKKTVNTSAPKRYTTARGSFAVESTMRTVILLIALLFPALIASVAPKATSVTRLPHLS